MHPPLGLITVAALCPKDWEVRLVDLNIESLSDEEILWSDLVFLGAMAVQKESLLETLDRCRALGRTSVVGGPMASGCPERVEGKADVLVLDEAELTLAEFLKDDEAGEPKKMYRNEDKPDITTSPLPRYDLLKLNAYSVIDVQYSRGCPFNCEFCDIIELYGRVPRTKTPEQILIEFDFLYNLGYRGPIFLVDDNFIGNKKNVRELLPQIAKWQEEHAYPYFLITEASVNLADDDEFLTNMRLAGFKRVFLGIETPSMESLKETQKFQNTKRDLAESVMHIVDSGLEVSGGFIVGFDNDQSDIFERQIAFIEQAEIPWAMVGTLTAIPGTQLWRRLEKEGRLHGLTDEKHNQFGRANFNTVMESNELYRGFLGILNHLYQPDAYYSRVLAVFDRHHAANHPNLHKAGYPIFKIGLLALVSSVVLGLKAPYRRSFWKYITTVVQRYPKYFAQALIHAIIGHHFIKYTAEIIAKEGVDLSGPPVAKVSQLTLAGNA